MLQETAEQKEQRLFDFYKNDLLLLADDGKKNWKCACLRFNCIEYVCSFPKIDPYKMAAVLVGWGIKIVFDDSSISQAENKRKENKVRRLVRAEQNGGKLKNV